jgi:hypothetical protein
MRVKISFERSSKQKPQLSSVREPILLHCASSAPQPPISFSEHLGKLGMAALRKQTAREVVSRKSKGIATAQHGLLGRVFSWLNGSFNAPKQLRVLETVALGEKRLVAVIQADGRRFLVGGGPSGVSLLTQLDQVQKSLNDFDSATGLSELAG